jgi:hypothetical protein
MPDRPPLSVRDSLAGVEGGDLVPVVAVLAAQQHVDDVELSLAALRQQTYGSLRILVATHPSEVERIRSSISANSGSEVVLDVTGAAVSEVVNEAAALVEGGNGLFWIVESGTAPEPNALRLLVQELLQSNAGVVGPKLVDLNDQLRVQSVGISVDLLGERAEPFNLDEVDQEQHDRVRDVLAVEMSGMLVRADLFHQLGGFTTPISEGVAEIDLCWRAHYAGARVVVVPDAVVGRRRTLINETIERRQQALFQVACDQLDTALIAVSKRQLVWRVVQAFWVSLLQLVLGIFLGAARQPARRLGALFTTPLRVRTVRARRKRMGAVRSVSDADVSPLLHPMSSRLTAIVKSHEEDAVVTAGVAEIRRRERTYGPTLTWFLIVLGLLVGSREFIRSGVPGVGAWLPVDMSSTDMLAQWWSPWDSRGVGGVAASAGGLVLLALLQAVPIIGSLLTGWGIGVGAVLCGLIGIQRITDVYPTARPRVIALIVYSAGPIVPLMLGSGDLDALVVYAVLPWIAHLSRRFAGIVAADVSTVEGDLVDGVLPLSQTQRRRLFSAIVLVTAVGGSLSPVVVPIAVVTLILFALSSWLMRSESIVALRFVTASGAAALSYVLLLPSSLGWHLSTFNGGELAGVVVNEARYAMSFGGDGVVGLLGAALLVPLIAGLLITRAWRLTWAVRGTSLVLSGMLLVVLAGRGVATAYIPTTSVLAVVMLFGASFPAAGIAGGFGTDVLDRSFGWRQPLALLATLGVVVSVIPGVLSVGAGDWDAPEYPMSNVLESQFPSNSATGSYRVLWVGDPRVLPVRGHSFEPGVSFVITDAGSVDITDALPLTAGSDAETVREALTALASGSTSRVGRLLAPLGIRYVAVPLADGVASTLDEPLVPPQGLSDALAAQLDVGVVQSPPTLEVFVNRSWIPPAAFLTGASAVASRNAGVESLLLADLDGVSAIALTGDGGEEFVDAVMLQGSQTLSVPSEGVLHLGIPFDRQWRVTAAGETMLPRAGFGQTVAFDIASGGEIVVSYDTPLTRYLMRLVIAVVWVGVLLAATRPERRRQHSTPARDEPLLTFEPSVNEEVEA